MKLKLAWMYYDLLELYGDTGNIKVFEYIAKKNNIEIEIHKITINNENIDISEFDIIFLGGGSDENQNIVESDLLNRKNQFQNVIKNNGFILTICGGYQMFGKYYIDSTGNKIEGLGIFDYYTEAGTNRCLGNVKIKSKIKVDNDYLEIIGFENHFGQTKGVDEENILGKVLIGNGNEYKGQNEGYLTKNFLGTYVHGPLLPKNPLLAKYILENILINKYNTDKIIKIDILEEANNAKSQVRFDN